MTEGVHLSRGKSAEQVLAELRGAPVTINAHEGELQQMYDDANEAEITLALINQALMFVSRAAEYSTEGLDGTLELLARATTEEAAPWAGRLTVAVRKLQDTAKGETS